MTSATDAAIMHEERDSQPVADDGSVQDHNPKGMCTTHYCHQAGDYPVLYIMPVTKIAACKSSTSAHGLSYLNLTDAGKTTAPKDDEEKPTERSKQGFEFLDLLICTVIGLLIGCYISSPGTGLGSYRTLGLIPAPELKSDIAHLHGEACFNSIAANVTFSTVQGAYFPSQGRMEVRADWDASILASGLCNINITKQWDRCWPLYTNMCRPTTTLDKYLRAMVEVWSNHKYREFVCENVANAEEYMETHVDSGDASNVKELKSYVLDAAKLMCSLPLAADETDRICAADILYMMHLDMANIRRRPSLSAEEVCDYKTYAGRGICQSDCTKLYQKFICMTETCSRHVTLLNSTFKPWQWFYSQYSNIIDGCKMSKDDCGPHSIIRDPEYEIRVEHPEYHEYFFHYTNLDMRDRRVIGGIVMASVITCGGVLIVILACYRRLQRRRDYRREKVQYSEVRGLMTDA